MPAFFGLSARSRKDTPRGANYKGWPYLRSLITGKSLITVRQKFTAAPWYRLALAGALLLTLTRCQQPLPGPGDQPSPRPRHAHDPHPPTTATAGHGHSAAAFDRHPDRLILTRHARCRMDCRHITEKEIREILDNGEINEHKSEPLAHPDPKYAVEGQTVEGQHLRIVVAVPTRSATHSPRTGSAGAGSALVIVTCIELGVEWQCDCH